MFVILTLVFGVRTLHLPWWLILVPVGLMVVNFGLIIAVRGQIRSVNAEEVFLIQSLPRIEVARPRQPIATTLQSPPPTYAAAAAEPPAYINPLKSPSYVSLVPTHTELEAPSNPHDSVSIEMP
ncbi:hypothetical protein K493DRAFT_317272 [Basidiobolus meristosporus CBS 931.73]|uniref:Transmembrane protein n=1 Tax=Basidiobolus meristosporus CBS 931.73 TaxID=1314790 RepID=A0A1Y1Y152_9FUNG|nr:hypothetical protein K493DRAFT_317272 [Basidiobolus meristosporus CBS 931.73]|eukprot:ORX91446.1 hypothetical protein K493DRAFT_317272 [Basidiobolus meristosporus CBS 931.73]